MTLFPGRAALLALVVAIGLTACSGSGKRDSASPATVTVTLGTPTVASPGAAVELTAAQKDALTKALTTYVTDAMADPLGSGKVGGDLAQVFDAGALEAATGPDRAALLDEGVPSGATTIAPISATVNALAGPDGKVAVIATTMKVDATTRSKPGSVTISRTATFAFTPDGSGWKVHSYDVTVQRNLPGSGATTTEAKR